MQYFGGKSRTWKQITQFLESIRQSEQTYFEPFVGGAWILQGMSGKRIASDANVALITMYKALQDGWIPHLVRWMALHCLTYAPRSDLVMAQLSVRYPQSRDLDAISAKRLDS